MIVDSGRTYIRTVRATALGIDPTLLQLRIASSLAISEVRPTSLPRSAIACVRRLADPTPGALSFLGAGEPPPREWEIALSRALDDLLATAAHPADGHASSESTAVVFADSAELLACLARDAVGGTAGGRWWWRSLFPGVDGPAAVIAAWLEQARHAPAALRRLAATNDAASFARALSQTEARQLTRAVCVAFALPGLDELLEVHSASPTSAPAATDRSASQTTVRLIRGASPAIPPPPWAEWVPEAEDASLDVHRRTFVGVGLMLHRSPALARSTGFAHAVAQWRTAAQQGSSPAAPYREGQHSSTPVGDTPRSYAATAPEFPKTGSTPAAAEAPAVRRRDHISDAAPTSNTRSAAWKRDRVLPTVALPSTPPAQATPGDGPRASVRAIGGVAPQPQRLPRPKRGDLPPAMSAIVRAARGGAIRPWGMVRRAIGAADPTEKRSVHPQAITAPAWPKHYAPAAADELGSAEHGDAFVVEIDTRLGGLFFLLNVGLALDLYADFTRPEHVNLPTSAWHFLSVVGGRLTGLRFRHDPIWPLLDRLGGAQPVMQCEAWRLPLDWLAPFPESAIWRWSRSANRLRVRHPAGFLVIDVPIAGDDPIRMLLSETYAYRQTAPFELRADVGLQALLLSGSSALDRLRRRSPVGRWLDWLMPYLHARFVRALGTSNPSGAQTLSLQSAHVIAGDTRVDVNFDLESLPIEVRLAGLDRDPGWLPSAGRSIYFHFAATGEL